MAHAITNETMVTIGLDLGDRQTAGCVVDEGGQILERFEARTTPTRWRPPCPAAPSWWPCWSSSPPRFAPWTATGDAGTTRYPVTELLRQVPGVAPLTALTYVLTLEDPTRFPRSRTVGAYLGLRPKRRDSGGQQPELSITKAGDGLLRRHLVTAAQYILGPFGPDTDLRRWGLALAGRAGRPRRSEPSWRSPANWPCCCIGSG